MAEGIHTFVIPAYQNSPFLEECIISLQKQTIPSQIIITTSTPSLFLFGIAKNYNIEISINKNFNNISEDWNFAYQQCQTKYLTLAHQDDIYLPEYTEKCLHVAENSKNQENLIIFTDYAELLINRRRRISFVLLVKKMLLIPFIIKNSIENHFLKKIILSLGNPISCPTVMFNKENIGEFKFSEDYIYNLDWDAWIQLIRVNGKFIYINKKLMLHRLHPESQTHIQIKNKNRIVEEEIIFRKLWLSPVAKLLISIYKFGGKFNLHDH